jgi:hypothetical protein
VRDSHRPLARSAAIPLDRQPEDLAAFELDHSPVPNPVPDLQPSEPTNVGHAREPTGEDAKMMSNVPDMIQDCDLSPRSTVQHAPS